MFDVLYCVQCDTPYNLNEIGNEDDNWSEVFCPLCGDTFGEWGEDSETARKNLFETYLFYTKETYSIKGKQNGTQS